MGVNRGGLNGGQVVAACGC